MENKLECGIVRDLMPSYVDGLTSETTNKAVEKHIAECTECAEVLGRMKEPQTEKPSDADVDYLKKIRRKTSRVGIICGIVMMVIGMLTIFSRVFFIGDKAGIDDISYNIRVEGNTVYVDGSFVSSTNGFSRMVFEESAGIVNVKVYTAPKTVFNSREFSKQYTLQNDFVGMVRCGDMILWEDGAEIGRMASKLFDAMNPFAGDMPSNQDIAYILGINEQFGRFSSELKTTSEPYGWILRLEEPVGADEETTARDIMKSDSCAMLAVIENLGYVTWEYTAGDVRQEYTITSEDASDIIGGDIKQSAGSASALQSLLQSVNVNWRGVRTAASDAFILNIRNESDEEIYGFAIDYYIDGDMIGGGGTVNADGSALKRGDELNFSFEKKDLSEKTSAVGLSDFSFDLYVLDENGNMTKACGGVSAPAKYAWTFSYTFSGDSEQGYTLSEK